MNDEYLSAEQVAELLGLHVRTVRAYLRQGRLKATRIGKQYRVARADLDVFTARGHLNGPVALAAGQAASEVTSVVQIDGIDPERANRLTTLLIAACSASKDDPLKQVSCRYLTSIGRLKVIISGSLDSSVNLLKLVQAMANE